MDSFNHYTVLKKETIDSLELKRGDHVIDCTAGGGGHLSLALEKVGPDGSVHAFDRDSHAIGFLTSKFSQYLDQNRLYLYHTQFSNLTNEIPKELEVRGILADLGVSSPQIDNKHRGFSFLNDGPLDMRMSPERGEMKAADFIATATEEQLEKVFREFGEEPKSKFVARAIVQERQKQAITSTLQLAEIVSNSIHYKTKSKKHPATKVFQALRIYINDELKEVSSLLEKAFNLLSPGGRMAIITFHSLEDRLVKRFYQQKAGRNNNNAFLKQLPLVQEEMDKLMNIQGRIIKPFPMTPSTHEIHENPRSRSAKLRILEKL